MSSLSMRGMIPVWILLLAGAPPGAAQSVVDGAAALPAFCTDGNGVLLPQCAAAASTGPIPRLPMVKAPPAAAPDPAKTAPPPESSEPARAGLPPEPPTEFQQFIAASTGRLLPLFGAELFQNVPSTFAPIDKVPVSGTYILGPGDELSLRVWGQVNLNLELTVDRTGSVFLPQIGNATVAGLALAQVQGFLRSQFERVYRNFDLSVTMGRLRSIQVFVVGQARRPGVYTVSSLSTLVNALFACGGPSAQGSMRTVELLRDGRSIAKFDIYSLLLTGDRAHDARLESGDVIHIGGVGSQAAIAGSIRRPAVYELRGEQSLHDLIAMAGGFTPAADGRRVKIERVAGGRRMVLEIALDERGSAAVLQNGDLVQVGAVAASFQNAVTLRGNVANPGRFAWREGLRLRDILPDKESLVVRAYWERHNLLGFTSVRYVAAREEAAGVAAPAVPARFGAIAPAINWTYAVIERRRAADLSRELLPFHLGRLVIDGDERENHELQPGDVVTVFSQADLRVPVAQQSRQVRLEGEFRAPGIYDVAEGETLGHLVDRVGGLTPDAYLYGAVFTRESARQLQQERTEQYLRDMERQAYDAAVRLRMSSAGAAGMPLEDVQRMIERTRAVKPIGRIALGFGEEGASLEKLQRLPLEDGDRLVVPPRPLTVDVLGAVYNAGSLLHHGDWRVKDYLKAAGGATRAGDDGRIFLIRADGTVVSRQSFGHFGPSFEMARVHPGDSLVVPEKPPKYPRFHSVLDWTRFSSEMALGASAVNLLR